MITHLESMGDEEERAKITSTVPSDNLVFDLKDLNKTIKSIEIHNSHK